MKKMLFIISVLSSLLVLSTTSIADSYTFYDSVVNEKMGKAAEKDKAVLSYDYSSGLLVILTKDGKKLDLKDGVYKMNNGEKFYVEKGAVVKHEKGKKKEDKKDKLKGLL
jgi:hypothetical protein